MSNSDHTPQPKANGEENVKQDEDDISHNKAGGDFDRMLATFDKHLVALKSVREPGRGRLTVGEALATALAQADAYEHWCMLGAPDGVIEVWVEEQRVMALHPGDATDLQGVLFESAGVPKAVVQVIRRADEIADTVILLNRELCDVLHKGGRCEQRHPNNRHVTLEVKREGKGQLSFWVGFNQPSEVPAGGLGILERLKCKAAQVGMCIRAQVERLREAWSTPTFGAVAAALTLVLFASISLSSREQTGTFAVARQPSPAAPAAVAATSNAVAAISNETSAQPTTSGALKVVNLGATGVWSKQSAAGASEVSKSAARAQTVKPRLAPTRVNVVAPKEERVPQDDDAVPLTILPKQESAVAAETSPWDTQRLRRLAEVHRVFLKVDNTTALNKEQTDDLLSSIKVALNELGLVTLLDESEKNMDDGVMVLRFEPDTTLLGAIFATMRDGDGNFLWEDHAGCRIVPDKGEWSATFNDASARLISKLPLGAKVASNRVDAKWQSVIGSKCPRLVRSPSAAQRLVMNASSYEERRMPVSQFAKYERE